MYGRPRGRDSCPGASRRAACSRRAGSVPSAASALAAPDPEDAPLAPTDIARALQAALRHHQRGEFAAAEQGYRRVLEADPDQPDANHLMGVLLDQTGHGEAGAALIRRAIAAAPGNPEAHCNLGRVLEGLGRLDEAVASYEAALLRRPDFGQARFEARHAATFGQMYQLWLRPDP